MIQFVLFYITKTNVKLALNVAAWKIGRASS